MKKKPQASGSIRPSSPDFIEYYDDMLDAAACARLIERFHASGQATPGRTGGGVTPSLKKSDDITISDHPEWRDAEAELNEVAFRGVVRYARRYPYVLLGPFAPTVSRPGEESRVAEPRDVEGDDDFRRRLAGSVLRPGKINIQHYLADQGGYPHWHCEFCPRPDGGESLHRLLLWTIYLNDGFDAGETEFLYQQRRIKPRAGALLIAPSSFTHTHRGNRPRGGDKYIATSWILFMRAQDLYSGT